jgi:hypothetical protein
VWLAAQTSTQGVPKVRGGVLRPVAVAVASGARGGDASGVRAALRSSSLVQDERGQGEVEFEEMRTEGGVWSADCGW